ncbi:hypothetical protein [uncultured Roseobacter sp.]|uniref:hypothetical protein n=1 Tax=uncultured Roseobacter sp. TaxID=114847 RepID=UPI002626694D|nr:hypothetical protein [uncultured Roseobacter sp.]
MIAEVTQEWTFLDFTVRLSPSDALLEIQASRRNIGTGPWSIKSTGRIEKPRSSALMLIEKSIHQRRASRVFGSLPIFGGRHIINQILAQFDGKSGQRQTSNSLSRCCGCSPLCRHSLREQTPLMTELMLCGHTEQPHSLITCRPTVLFADIQKWRTSGDRGRSFTRVPAEEPWMAVPTTGRQTL